MDDPRLTRTPARSPAPGRPRDPSLAPAPVRGDATGGMLRVLPWVVVTMLLVAVAWLAWEAFGPEEYGDPLATSLVAFEEQNELTVFSAQLSPVVSAEDSRFLGLLESRQVAVIPARVDYRLDLGEVTADRLAWDEETLTLDVRLPPIEVGKPNLDEGRAQYLREGLWITREAQDALTRDNTRLAERQAVEQAANPVLMDLARAAAVTAVKQNLAIPLQVAGFGDVTVRVRFDDGPAPAQLEADRSAPARLPAPR